MKKRQIAVLVMAGGIFIFLLKLLAFFLSNSVALLSDAMESIINIAASIMMFIAIVISERPPDENHKYGHQKAENISSFIEGILIIIAAVLIVEATIGRLISPVDLGNIDIALLVSLFATSLNGVLGFIMIKEARRSSSMALEGDAKHLFSDVMSSVGVVVGLFIATLTGLYILDPLIALVVAGLLIFMGINVIRKTMMDLMDHYCPEEEAKIIETIKRCGGFQEFHDMKTRRSGSIIFAEFHMCLDGKLSIDEAHDLTEKIREELEKAIPGIVLNIHIESFDKNGA